MTAASHHLAQGKYVTAAAPMTAYLTGTFRQPEVALVFGWGARHAANNQPLQEWVKKAPGRRWDPERKCWVMTGFGAGRNPEALLMKAGFRVDIDHGYPGEGGLDPSLANILSLNDLIAPMAKASVEKAAVALVRHRFYGWDDTKELLGMGAHWDKATGRFEVPLTDLLVNGDPKPGIIMDADTIAKARELLTVGPISFNHAFHSDESIALAAASAASSSGVGDGHDEAAVQRLVDVVGDIPEWFGMTPRPYQRLGALALITGRGFLADPTGLGKGSPDWVKILTPTGWTTYADIAVGDQVIGSNGKPTAVTGVYPRGVLPTYKVTFNDGANVVVDGDHLWQVETPVARRENRHPRVLSTRQIMEEGFSSEDGKHRSVHYIPMVEPVQFAPAAEPLPIDPYLLGALIGDGSFAGNALTFSNIDQHIIAEVRDRLAVYGCTLVPRRDRRKTPGTDCDYGIRGPGGQSKPNPLVVALRDLGLWGHRAWEKFIPTNYLFASPEDRLELLRGIADTDGTVGVAPDVVTTSPQLADDIEFLVQSLGGTARRSEKTPRFRSGSGSNKVLKDGRRAYRVGLCLPAEFNPFKTPTKADLWSAPWKYPPHRTIRSIEPAAEENVTCISVEAEDRLYVTEDFIVTHNTVQIIGAFALRKIQRGVIIVPPVVVTHWAREIEKCNLAFPPAPPMSKAALKRQEKAAKKAAIDAAIAAGMDPEMAARMTFRPAKKTAAKKTAHAPETAKETTAPAEVSVVSFAQAPGGSTSATAPPESIIAELGNPDDPSVTAVSDAVDTKSGNSPLSLVTFRAGRKEPELPDRGIVVVPDSLLAARPALREKIAAWAPDGIAYDEAHRARTWKSVRSEAVRDLCNRSKPGTLRIASTATPLFSSPHELASLLAITGHLDSVFGGYSSFIATYCKRNFFKQLVPRVEMLPQLHQILREQVWVRRDKKEVLKDLPSKSREAMVVDVDLKGFRAAHNEVIDTVTEWLDAFWLNNGREPDDEEVEDWAKSQIGLMSPLRKAAGVAKVPAALDLAAEWLDENVFLNADETFTCDRPLLLWAHHQDVVEAVRASIASHIKATHTSMVAVIDGSTSATERGRLVDEFQAGRLPILVCSITAAGVGITLTKSSDALFIETDYSPPIVSQAEDRIWRMGQTKPVTITTMIAEGTLDDRIQAILSRKSETIGEVTGDVDDVSVIEGAGDLSPSDIIVGLVNEARTKWKVPPAGAVAAVG